MINDNSNTKYKNLAVSRRPIEQADFLKDLFEKKGFKILDVMNILSSMYHNVKRTEAPSIQAVLDEHGRLTERLKAISPKRARDILMLATRFNETQKELINNTDSIDSGVLSTLSNVKDEYKTPLLEQIIAKKYSRDPARLLINLVNEKGLDEINTDIDEIMPVKAKIDKEAKQIEKEYEAQIKQTKPPIVLPAVKPIVEIPSLFTTFKEEYRQFVNGQEKEGYVTFAVMLSAYLDKPTGLIIKGESSAGKSVVMKTCAGFFPETTIFTGNPLTSISPMFLSHFGKDDPNFNYDNKLIVAEELGSVANANETLKLLMSEGQISHGFVDSNDSFKANVNQIKGTPAFVTTTTKPKIEDELSTRILTITVAETRDQLIETLKFIGSNVNNYKQHTRPNVDTSYTYRHILAIKEKMGLQKQGFKIKYPKEFTEKLGKAFIENINLPPQRAKRDFKQGLLLLNACQLAFTPLDKLSPEIDLTKEAYDFFRYNIVPTVMNINPDMNDTEKEIYEIIINLWGKANAPSKFAKAGFVQHINPEFAKFDENTEILDQQGISVTQILSKYELSQQNTNDYLRGMVRRGILTRTAGAHNTQYYKPTDKRKYMFPEWEVLI